MAFSRPHSMGLVDVAERDAVLALESLSGEAEEDAHQPAAVSKGGRELVGGNLTGAPGHRESQVAETVLLGGGSLGRPRPVCGGGTRS
jgi:hypothetical protein